jgi:hypothetical protein
MKMAIAPLRQEMTMIDKAAMHRKSKGVVTEEHQVSVSRWKMSGYALGTRFRVHEKIVKTVWIYTQSTTVY